MCEVRRCPVFRLLWIKLLWKLLYKVLWIYIFSFVDRCSKCPGVQLLLFILFMGFSRQEYWSGLPFPSPLDHILSEVSNITCHLGWPYRAWLVTEALVIANILFQQHKRRLYTWTSPDGQYWNQIDYILWSQRWGSSIQSAKTRLGTDCGSDHELLIAKTRLKLKKVGKTTRPFRYDLNQIPYDYTVEVTNRFKGLDLISK